MPPPAPAATQSESSVPGLYAADSITLDVPNLGEGGRPPPVKFMSTPAYISPLRHHRRAASSTRHVKETLNARSEYSNSEDDGSAQHRINQYLIKQEIGRGSFGAVHLAVDQYNHEYAVKEFSKSRLRKRAQSNLLRRPSARRRQQAGLGFNVAMHRHGSHLDENNSLDLIKEEIAIMKKLNHPNLVSLIEVLDDPEEDSLYMVMEMCKKGVVMQVGLDERADPYDEEQCRCWFRDMILGIEYLHAQGIIHRDIKPDNCLVTDDDVLKIVDFGVSEMFDKEGEMRTAKSAGSPAFMPPELCVPKHGEVSGKAADIWSMGVTLYCLLYGRIPFEKHGMIELYQSIRMEELAFDTPCPAPLEDLLKRLLEKDPEKRIKMQELREHPWVTKQGSDTLLSTDENVAIIVEEPTDEEVNAAITGNMGHLVTVVRAVKRFKQLLFRRRPELMEGILGSASRIVQPPLSMRPSGLRKSKSQDTDDRRAIESALTAEGVHRDIKIDDNFQRAPPGIDDMAFSKPGFRDAVVGNRPPEKGPITSSPTAPQAVGLTDAKVVHENMSYRPGPRPAQSINIPNLPVNSAPSTPTLRHNKGQAHDPLEDEIFLNIGTGEDCPSQSDSNNYFVSESPSNVEMNVYETAYEEEISRIMNKMSASAEADGEGTGTGTGTGTGEGEGEGEGSSSVRRRPTLYMTRRVENAKSLQHSELIIENGRTRTELKQHIKTFVKKASKNVEERAEMQRLEGKEDLLSRGWRNMREFKERVDEARDIVREEERTGSRSTTPLGGGRGSRSATPVAGQRM